MSEDDEGGWLSRRRAIGVASTGIVALAGAVVIGAGSIREVFLGGDDASPETSRALAAYEALQNDFYLEQTDLYVEEVRSSGTGGYSTVWPFSQAVAATQDVAGMPDVGEEFEAHVRDRFEALELYWNDAIDPPGYDSAVRPPLGTGGDLYYDDNLWIALEFVQRYRTSGDEAALERARDLFDLMISGWADDDSYECPGGVYWTRADWNDDRNTVSTAPSAKLGLHLCELTDDPDEKEYYLTWSNRMYDWVDECLRAPNGLYWDNIDPDGNVWEEQFSYNQGTMIGANVLLYRNTGETAYLERAEELAETALDHFESDGRFFDQDIDFNAIFFSNLLLLKEVNDESRYTDSMREYADTVWDEYVDPETGLVDLGGDGSTHLLEQSALVRLYASLAWDEGKYRNRA